MPKMAVQLVRRAPTGEVCVRIQLWSEKKPAIISQNYVDPDVSDLEYQVAVSAGALAEHQCKTYGDRHNPDQLAEAAVRMLKILKAKGEKTNRKIERDVS